MDYYEVLGVSKKATMDEIKEAYRALAMKYHPDVNTTGETHQPNADKFRQIAEAYAVLSIPENKMVYDLSYEKNEEAIYSSVKSETMEKHRKKRDVTGHVPKPKPVRGSYAEYRLNYLEKEREKYNVNHLGYYNGGLPRKGLGSIRGNAANLPGSQHFPDLHNDYERFERDSAEVTPSEALTFKTKQNIDKEPKTRPVQYNVIETDREWKYVTNRTFATFLLLGLFGYSVAKRVYEREKARAHRTERHPDNLVNATPHYFVNRGGVLLKKEFEGFAKYFKNDEELKEWYKTAYPDLFGENTTDNN